MYVLAYASKVLLHQNLKKPVTSTLLKFKISYSSVIIIVILPSTPFYISSSVANATLLDH
jgi:hypothetical protein